MVVTNIPYARSQAPFRHQCLRLMIDKFGNIATITFGGDRNGRKNPQHIDDILVIATRDQNLHKAAVIVQKFVTRCEVALVNRIYDDIRDLENPDKFSEKQFSFLIKYLLVAAPVFFINGGGRLYKGVAA
ncbi:hypothetical protein MPER_04469 [Moniliophthora perniciosa FA553]|nr:hypothetical protein MPER_04469 [Moniliophthora perniciosa FA553]